MTEKSATDKLSTTLPGTVEEIITSLDPNEPEKAQIGIGNVNETHREIRIENTLKKKDGDEVSLKKGAVVKVIIEA